MAHSRAKVETFQRRWKKLRERLIWFDPRCKLDDPNREPKLKKMGLDQLASKIDKLRPILDKKFQGVPFHRSSIESWERGTSLPKTWHLRAILWILGDLDREIFNTSHGVDSWLVWNLLNPEVPEEDWEEELGLYPCPNTLEVYWSRREKSWAGAHRWSKDEYENDTFVLVDSYESFEAKINLLDNYLFRSGKTSRSRTDGLTKAMALTYSLEELERIGENLERKSRAEVRSKDELQQFDEILHKETMANPCLNQFLELYLNG